MSPTPMSQIVISDHEVRALIGLKSSNNSTVKKLLFPTYTDFYLLMFYVWFSKIRKTKKHKPQVANMCASVPAQLEDKANADT